MANFSINFGANDELLAEVNECFKKLTEENESKVQALPRILRNALKYQDEITMLDNGVDLKALNVCFDTVKQQFVTIAQSRSVMESEYREKYDALNKEYAENLNRLNENINKIEKECAEVKLLSNEAQKEKELALKEAEQFEKRAITAEKRAEEQSATIDRLNAEATVNQTKIDEYDDLKFALEEANKNINNININIKDREHEYLSKLNEKQGIIDFKNQEIKNIQELSRQEKKSLIEKIEDRQKQLSQLNERLEKSDYKNDKLQEKYEKQIELNQKQAIEFQEKINELNEMVSNLMVENKGLKQLVESKKSWRTNEREQTNANKV